jgi:WD40 repeat protein
LRGGKHIVGDGRPVKYRGLIKALLVKLSFTFLLILVLSACSIINPTSSTGTPIPEPTRTLAITLVPSATVSPTPIFTLTPTPIPTATPTPTLLVLEGTPIPDILEPISFANAGMVSSLAEWQVETVNDLAWTPDSITLAVAQYDRISLYDRLSRSLLKNLSTDGGLNSIAFSPSGAYLATGHSFHPGTEQNSGRVNLYNVSDWDELGALYEDARGVSEVAYSPDGRWLAAAFSSLEINDDNVVVFWDTSDLAITTTYKTSTALSIAFSPDGELLVSTPDRYAIQTWQLQSGELLNNSYTSFTGAVNTIIFSPDGTRVATGHYDGVILVWEAETGEILQRIETGSVVESLAFNPDGSLLASGEGFDEPLVKLWDPGSGVLLRSLNGHTHAVDSIAFSPDGRILASGSYDGTVRLWGVRP